MAIYKDKIKLKMEDNGILKYIKRILKVIIGLISQKDT